MLRLLCPQWVFDNYEAVTPEFLKEHGVKLLLADLDFTLAPKSQSEPDESLTRWIGTDTLGARRSGVLMLMVEPRGGAVGAWNHVLHALQQPFKAASAHDERKKH